jgi:phosphoribosylformimino-5-aminoimidazole carboxamide ribotide isomerase
LLLNKLKIDFGGGLKSDADLKIAFDSGANQITGAALLSRTELYSKMDSRIRF